MANQSIADKLVYAVGTVNPDSHRVWRDRLIPWRWGITYHIVCLNEDEARKEAADREAIVAALREQLRHGDKSLVGHKGYRRYLSTNGSQHFPIDEAKIAAEARSDGKWVLRTHTDLDSAEVALQHKQLWMVERWFRSCTVVVADPPDRPPV